MLTALTLIYLSSLSLSEQTGHRHRPTLVVCPPGVINTWLTEASRRFGDALPLYIFHRSAEHTGDVQRKSCTLSNAKQLQDLLWSLDPDNAKTSHTIILTLYATWSGLTPAASGDALCAPFKRLWTIYGHRSFVFTSPLITLELKGRRLLAILESGRTS